LKEEALVSRDEIDDLTLRAIVYGPWTAHMEMIYSARLKPPCEEIIDRKVAKAEAKGLSAEEAEDKLLFIPTTKEVVTSWLTRGLHAGVPVGVAALYLSVGKSFGSGWEGYAANIFADESRAYSDLTDGGRRSADLMAIRHMKELIDLCR